MKMATIDSRNLTPLEYMVLGFLSITPQTGYSIISAFELDHWRVSVSPGTVYPILKRLEQQNYITGAVERVGEVRGKKVYSLTTSGEDLLDGWLRAPITKLDVALRRDTLLAKFFFAEKRLSHQEVITWLESYEEETEHYRRLLEIKRAPGLEFWSPHSQLLVEAAVMELHMQQAWIQLARRHLHLAKNQEGES